MEGRLKKRNQRGQWQERHFVQTDRELRYYESAKKDKDPKGVIRLAGILMISVVEGDKKEAHCLEIRCRDRNFILAATTAQAARDWCSSIEEGRVAAGARPQTAGDRSSVIIDHHSEQSDRSSAVSAGRVMLTVAVPLAEVGGARSGAEDNRIQKAADALKSAMEGVLSSMGAALDVVAVAVEVAHDATLAEGSAAAMDAAFAQLQLLCAGASADDTGGGNAAEVDICLASCYGLQPLPPAAAAGAPHVELLALAARCGGGASPVAVSVASGRVLAERPASSPALGAGVLQPLLQDALQSALRHQLRPAALATSLQRGAAAAARGGARAPPRPAPSKQMDVSSARLALERLPSIRRGQRPLPPADGDDGPSLLQLYQFMKSEEAEEVVDELDDDADLSASPMASTARMASASTSELDAAEPTRGGATGSSMSLAFVRDMRRGNYERAGTGHVEQIEALVKGGDLKGGEARAPAPAGANAPSPRAHPAAGAVDDSDADDFDEGDAPAEQAGPQGGAAFRAGWTAKQLRAIRQVVSLNKKRFQEEGFDLDLTYITPRIIAMGFPSEDTESMYRNPRKEVQAFFETRHHDHYKVYNLCGERTYEANTFANRVAIYPFEDHNAPALQIIEDAMVDMSRWLDDHPKNVVAVHCKAGKGRTGIMVCCLLYWRGYFSTMEQALEFYAKMRTDDMDGVTIPSQRRFVLYFEQWRTRPGCCLELSPEGPPSLRLRHIRMGPAPKNVSPRDTYFVITQSGGRCWRGERLADSRELQIKTSIAGLGLQGRKPTLEWDWSQLAKAPLDLPRGGVVRGDIRVEVMQKDKRLFRFWFHSAFVENGVLCIPKAELDGPHKDRKCKHYEQDFAAELFFDEIDGEG